MQDAMCVAVMKEMNHIFEEENVPAEIVLYEVRVSMEKWEGELRSFCAGSTSG